MVGEQAVRPLESVLAIGGANGRNGCNKLKGDAHGSLSLWYTTATRADR